eukprot:TCALIF_08691-PA protein Name:"Protein of unknown function" AED:0.19 eAED:0.19 QI:15/0.5/0.33/1/1/1/3/0/289
MFTITTQSRFKSKSDGIVECVSLRTPTKRESRPLHFVFNSLMESTSEGQLPTVKNAKIVSLPPPVCPDHPSQTTGSDNNLTTPIQVKRIKYHCFHCKKVFLSRTGWKEHASAAGADHENLQPCREPHATHRLVSGTFDSFDEARAWATAQEFDKTMSIVTSQTNYLIYKCRHNSRLKGSRLKPCPQRRRVSLMPFDCKARVVKEQEDIIQQVEEIEAKLKMKEVLNSAVDPGLSSTKTKNQREETPTESFMALPTGVIQANHWSNADIALEEEVQHCLESPVEDPNWLP